MSDTTYFDVVCTIYNYSSASIQNRLTSSVARRSRVSGSSFFMKLGVRARAMTSSAPTEFQHHRRRRRDERFDERIENVDERERILVCFPLARRRFSIASAAFTEHATSIRIE